MERKEYNPAEEAFNELAAIIRTHGYQETTSNWAWFMPGIEFGAFSTSPIGPYDWIRSSQEPTLIVYRRPKKEGSERIDFRVNSNIVTIKVWISKLKASKSTCEICESTRECAAGLIPCELCGEFIGPSSIERECRNSMLLAMIDYCGGMEGVYKLGLELQYEQAKIHAEHMGEFKRLDRLITAYKDLRATGIIDDNYQQIRFNYEQAREAYISFAADLPRTI